MDRPIRRQIEVDALPRDVWAALVTPERLGGWFGASVDLDLRPGGALTFRMLDGSARRGVVEVVEPPRRFAFRWRSVRLGPDGVQVGDVSRVEFVLEPEEAAVPGSRWSSHQACWRPTSRC